MGKGRKKKPKPKPAPKPPKKRARKRKRQNKQKNAPPPKRRKKPGPPSYADGKVLPRKAGYKTQLTYAVEKKLSAETHAKRRQGYNLMWRFAPKKCEQLGFRKPGTFAKDNGHNGECWGWKKECNITDIKAGKILLHLVNLETLTVSQLEVVRKSLAYSYQLMGHAITKYNTNWPEVRKVWKAVRDKDCAPTKSTKPKRIPTPEELKAAFTQHWHPEKNEMTFVQWIIARRAAYDTLFCGHRPNKDMEKMKVTRRHHIHARGWCWTDFKDGRSKLVGPKKNSRDWKQFAVCWCTGGRHRTPTLRDRYNLDEYGNPRNGDPGFDDLCITAGFQFTNLWQRKGDWPRYPNLVGTGRGKSKKGNVGTNDVGHPIKLALRWMEDQGLGTFDSNSGRKALARLLSKLNIPYEEGFEIHGDTYGTWESRYQNGCRKVRDRFCRRTQSTELEVVTKALRKISHWMGLGSKKPAVQLTVLERQNDLMLRAMGLSSQADAILLGLNAKLPEGYQRPVKPESIERVKPEPKT